MEMLCDGCIYRGKNFEHLSGHNGTDVWLHCKYPVPFWAVPRAMPDVPLNGNKCDVRKKRLT